MPVLYAYAYPHHEDDHWDDPHAIQILLHERPDLLRDEWTEVVDAHGNQWEVRSAPCNLTACHCAAEARIIQYHAR